MDSKSRKGALVVACNQVITEGAVLLRNILLARLLGPEQMGIVIMLAIALRMLEMLSYLAADRLLVQARDGYSFRFLANAHGLEIVRGAVSGLVLGALAKPIAGLFGYPDTAWAFALLGLVPLVRGFVHLDYKRLQRRLQFGATIKVESIANLAGTVAVWPAVALAGDHMAIVWVSLVQALVFVGVSHNIAHHRYALRFDRRYLQRIFNFGWPMMVNSLLMFGVFQGDKLIVAFSLTAQELSRYALALQLGLLPTMVLGRACLSLMLPKMARLQDQEPDFLRSYRKLVAVLTCTASCFLAAYVYLGNEVITLFFGHEFSLSPIVLAWIGLAMAFRIIRVGTNTAALALGDSKSLMYANLWRILGLFVAACAGVMGLGLEIIVAAAAFGELSALLASTVLLHHRQGVTTSIPAVLSLCLALFVIVAWTTGLIQESLGPAISHASVGLVVALTVFAMWRAFKFTTDPQQGVSF